jgi:hypothetical protein
MQVAGLGVLREFRERGNFLIGSTIPPAPMERSNLM